MNKSTLLLLATTVFSLGCEADKVVFENASDQSLYDKLTLEAEQSKSEANKLRGLTNEAN